MIMGIIILKKRYTIDKYLSVLMITAGIVLCTIVSSKEISKSSDQINQQSEPMHVWDDFFWWIIGIVILTVALFISARMGIFQETLYARYGKNPREALYYTVFIRVQPYICFFNTLIIY